METRSALAEPTAPPADEPSAPTDGEPLVAAEELLVDEVLVEEISIDGMCGVY